VTRHPPADPADPLQTLLVRCHRDELEGLAALVKLDLRGMGHADVARNAARALRRLGAHAVANAALRGGEGPPYVELLQDLVRRDGGDPAQVGDEEALEMAVLSRRFSVSWDQMDEQARGELWSSLGLPAPSPAGGAAALDSASKGLGRSFGYRLAQAFGPREPTGWLTAFGVLGLHPFGCLFRFILVPLLPVAIAWALRRDEKRLVAGVVEVARLRQILLHRVTIGVVGSPSTGKDAAIRALFGIETGNISPIAGSTREVSIQRVPGATALFLVNTPGMGDVVERVTEEARQVLDHIDVYLYLVNSEGGVQARELADYQRCVATGKPVLAIVNKVDVLRPRDKERYLADARAKLGAPERDFIDAALDPLPQLAPAPIHREEIHGWVSDRLRELGKDPAELPPLPTVRLRES